MSVSSTLPIARLVLVASFDAVNQGLVTTRSILVAQRRIHWRARHRVVYLLKA